MGYYINPKNEEKEDFIKREGRLISAYGYRWSVRISEHGIPLVPVVLIDKNNAALIAFDEEELNRVFLSDDDDKREKQIFLVPLDKILEVTGGNYSLLKEFLKSGLIK